MNVIPFPIHFNQFNIKISTNTGKVASQFFNCILIKYFSPVFCDKDQMDVHQEYTMSATANISFIFHRPKYNSNMKRLQAFKFQLRPNGQQEREMRRFAGACRFVFNRALARQNENYEAGNKYIPYTKMASHVL